MSPVLGRRAFVRGVGSLLMLGITGCSGKGPGEEAPAQVPEDQDPADDDAAERKDDVAGQGDAEETTMQISVTVNDVPFTATLEDTAAGQELLARLPLTLSMDELHGNEKYCYTGEPFGGESYVPETIEAGDLMVYGADCLVLFYETFANGGWSYQRVGRIDNPGGLADACGSGAVTVTFESVT